MVKDLKQSPEGEYPWMRKVQLYIAYGQKGRALQVLEKVIERDMPLFDQLPGIFSDFPAWRSAAYLSGKRTGDLSDDRFATNFQSGNI